MKIATWNVNGIRARETQFAEWVETEQPDVICLQEIKASPDKVPESIAALPDYHCLWHGEGGYSGIALHVRRSLAGDPRYDHPSFDMETRIATAVVGDVTVASVYVPNGGKDFDAKMAFLESLEQWIATMHADSRQVVVCGDINIAHREVDVHPKERKPDKAIGQLAVERERFDSILSRGVVDLGRHFDPDNDALFTWWAPWRNMRQRNIGWRIDYVLASEPLVAHATGCIVRPEVGTSDHAPVVATFEP